MASVPQVALLMVLRVTIRAISETDTKNPGKPFPAHGPELLASAAAVHTPQTPATEETRARIADIVPSPDPEGDFVLEPRHIANIVRGSMILANNALSNSWSAIPQGLKSLS